MDAARHQHGWRRRSVATAALALSLLLAGMAWGATMQMGEGQTDDVGRERGAGVPGESGGPEGLQLTPGPWWRPGGARAGSAEAVTARLLPQLPPSPWWNPGAGTAPRAAPGTIPGVTPGVTPGVVPGAGAGAGWVPVEQAVGDLDVLSRSLRRVESGIGQFGQGTSLYRLEGGAMEPVSLQQEPMYYRVSPGVRARVGRMDYLVPTEEGGAALNMPAGSGGRFLELVPPNTVFDLALPGQGSLMDAAGAAPVLGPDQRLNSLPGDARLNGRVDTRLDQRVNGRVE